MPTSAVTVLAQEVHDLEAEEQAILTTSDAAVARGEKLSAEQFDRLAAIQERLPKAQAQHDSLAAARDRRNAEPAVTEAATAAIVAGVSGGPTASPTPFGSLGEFLGSVADSTRRVAGGGRADQRLLDIQAAAAGANETVGADGGYLVQKDISNDLLERVFDTGILSRRARRIPVGPNANGIKINVVDETSRATGSRWGGVQVYWAAEAGAATASRPKFKPLEMTLQKLIGLFYATDELLADTTALDAVAGTAFTDEFGFMVDDAMVRGNGAGKPLGVLSAPALVSVAKETGQAADTFIAENVLAMFPRMAPRSIGSAIWYINQELWPQIFKMAIAVGTGGIPVFLPSNAGITSSPGGTLLGRPIEPIEQCSAIGDQGDVIFGDFGQYALIEKGGIVTASSIHVQFLTDEMTFRWTLRTNGQPTWTSARTPYKGSATLSPFVTLDAR